jgi:hypothetical protein
MRNGGHVTGATDLLRTRLSRCQFNRAYGPCPSSPRPIIQASSRLFIVIRDSS